MYNNKEKQIQEHEKGDGEDQEFIDLEDLDEYERYMEEIENKDEDIIEQEVEEVEEDKEQDEVEEKEILSSDDYDEYVEEEEEEKEKEEKEKEEKEKEEEEEEEENDDGEIINLNHRKLFLPDSVENYYYVEESLEDNTVKTILVCSDCKKVFQYLFSIRYHLAYGSNGGCNNSYTYKEKNKELIKNNILFNILKKFNQSQSSSQNENKKKRLIDNIGEYFLKGFDETKNKIYYTCNGCKKESYSLNNVRYHLINSSNECSNSFKYKKENKEIIETYYPNLIYHSHPRPTTKTNNPKKKYKKRNNNNSNNNNNNNNNNNRGNDTILYNQNNQQASLFTFQIEIDNLMNQVFQQQQRQQELQLHLPLRDQLNFINNQIIQRQYSFKRFQDYYQLLINQYDYLNKEYGESLKYTMTPSQRDKIQNLKNEIQRIIETIKNLENRFDSFLFFYIRLFENQIILQQQIYHHNQQINNYNNNNTNK